MLGLRRHCWRQCRLRNPRVLKRLHWYYYLGVLCLLLRLGPIKDNRWTILDGGFFFNGPKEGTDAHHRDESHCPETNDNWIEKLPRHPK